MNLYGFAGGDPVNFNDPFGLTADCLLLPCPVVMGAGSILGGLSAGTAAAVAAPISIAIGLAVWASLPVVPIAASRSIPGALVGADATATGGSIPASGPRATAGERRAVNDIGGVLGCHECGAAVPGTQSGNWIPDHQPPTALNPPGGDQTLEPHCTVCSAKQGGRVSQEVKRRKAPEPPPQPPKSQP